MSQNEENRRLINEYRSRINRVIDYIENNIDQPLNLKELSDVAGFSPYHFHRIFTGQVGETLNGFIQRIRIEKVALKLVQNPGKSITDIAFETGFSGSSSLARAFREKFGVSPSRWRSETHKEFSKTGMSDSKIRMTDSNDRQVWEVSVHYNRAINEIKWRVHMKDSTKNTEIEVVEMPELTVAYVRHIGAYQGDASVFENLFNRLATWAGPRGLMTQPDVKVISMYYDDPDLTDDSKLRVDACITVPADTEVDGEVGKTTIPAGKYAVGHFELGTQDYGDAWNSLYSGWLPESGYQPADGPAYELYPGNMEEGDVHKVDIYIPVKPM